MPPMIQHTALATASMLLCAWGSGLGAATQAAVAEAVLHPEDGGRRVAATGFPGLNTSNQRMAARLAHIRETADPSSMAYLTDRQIPRLEAALKRATNFQQQASLRFNLSNQLLLSGRTDDALGIIRDLEGQVAGTGGRLREGLEAELRIRKAIAYLRLGEQENCQLNHTTASCLLPIGPDGWHRLPRGSRSAIPLLNEQLTAHPDDLGARWLLNIAHMTLGEWPAKVSPRWLIPETTFSSEGKFPRFPDVASAVGLDVDDLAGIASLTISTTTGSSM